MLESKTALEAVKQELVQRRVRLFTVTDKLSYMPGCDDSQSKHIGSPASFSRRLDWIVSPNFFGDLLPQARPLRQTSTERFQEFIVALAALRTHSRLACIRESDSRAQPGANENGEGFVGDADITFQPLHVAVNAIKALCNRGFLPPRRRATEMTQ